MIKYLFSFSCPICNFSQDNENICSGCFFSLKFLPISCKKCQQPFQFDMQGVDVCEKCLQNNTFFEEMFCPFVYNDFMKMLILRFKNDSDFGLGKMFAKFINNKINNKIPENTIIISVPLHNKRILKRGYNQSVYLAKKLAHIGKYQFIEDFLIRHINTPSQGFKTISERKTNVENAFIVNSKYKSMVKENHFLIIDDVITTGATIFECAKQLEGAKGIFLASIARRVKEEKITF